MNVTTIETWLDLEAEIPARYHNCLRVYRLFQTLNRGSLEKDGKLRKAIKEWVSVLELSQRTIRNILSQGEGLFWRVAGETVFLVGYRKVYLHFRCEPKQEEPQRIPVEKIAGHVANFRGLVAAAKVRCLEAGMAFITIARAKLAKKLGVSVRTLHKYAKVGWLNTRQQAEYIGDAHIKYNHYWVQIEPSSKQERYWEDADGNRFLIKQTESMWQDCFTGQEYELPETLPGLFDNREELPVGKILDMDRYYDEVMAEFYENM